MIHLLILFFATFSAALMGVAPPGLINITAAKISSEKGKMNGILFATGASVTVVLQAYIAVLISKYLYNNPFVLDILLKIALLIFAFFAIYFFIMARKNGEQKVRKKAEVKKRNSFYKGVFLAILNILPIPYFCGLNAAWNVSGWIKFQLSDILVFIMAAGMGTFAMLYLYVVYFDKLQTRSDRFSRYSDYILSVLMFILLIITLIRILYAG